MSAPEKIFLQWHDDPNAEISWCEDPVADFDDIDVKYIRADISEKLVKEIKEALKQNIAHCKKCCRDNSILDKLPNKEVENDN